MIADGGIAAVALGNPLLARHHFPCGFGKLRDVASRDADGQHHGEDEGENRRVVAGVWNGAAFARGAGAGRVMGVLAVFHEGRITGKRAGKACSFLMPAMRAKHA